MQERTAKLGKLPVGYYELREKSGSAKVTAAVLAKSTPIEETPIALDASMSWFYPNADQVRDACTLCKLAGVRWVRDRLSWPEMEPTRGTWAGETRYERTMRIEHEAGLKILQVNHASPGWASANPAHFPDDLRDVYEFYRRLAKRWNGLADAIEPWNEADIELFGGHTGCEIASFQKAAFLGLKAGDPARPVNGAVFAIDRVETLNDFGDERRLPVLRSLRLAPLCRVAGLSAGVRSASQRQRRTPNVDHRVQPDGELGGREDERALRRGLTSARLSRVEGIRGGAF